VIPKPKIIHILGHSPGPGAYQDISDSSEWLPRHYIRIKQFPYWVGFFEEDFFVMVANKITEQTDKYVNECWRPYIGCDKVYSKEIDGVMHRIFPSIPPKAIKLKRDYDITTENSALLIERLNEEINKGNVLVHFHGFPGGPNDAILRKVDFESVPVVIQHRGSSFRHERNLEFGSLSRKIYNFICKIIEYSQARFVYSRKVDIFLSLSRYELKTFRRMGLENVMYHRDGRNFDFFPEGNKNDARKKLDLPLDKKIILYVGKFSEHRGVDKIVRVYHNLKNRMEVQFIFIGGHENDEHYTLVKKSGTICLPRIERKKLIDYYQACDLTINIDSDHVQKYNGISGVPLEGIACGAPSVSRSLIHFIGTAEERKQIGEIPERASEKDVEKCVLKILKNPLKYSRCGEIIRKYYEFDITIKRNLKIYEYLLRKYYRNIWTTSD
jgi:glycosyltransferase involved in cell wall biosynthesis